MARRSRGRHGVRVKTPDLIVDGVERRRLRPKDPAKMQTIHYSGKKKHHVDKNVVVVNTRE